MSDYDWALERMADELDRLKAQVTLLSGESDRRTAAAVAPEIPVTSEPAEHSPPDPVGTPSTPDATNEYTSGARS